jgi:alkylation response protein AidB-like acyl-CoA dehydrogenase
MDLDLTPDQRSFQAATRQFLARSVPISAQREQDPARPAFDRGWWRQGAELGWTAMLVPEALGGGTVSGRGTSDLAIVVEEMGRVCAPGPLVTTSAVLTGLARAGERFAAPIEAVLTGESVASWAVYEPARGLDLTTPGTTAEPLAGGFRITGVKDRVEAGDAADLFLVTARGPAGPVQVLVAADAPGVTVEPAWTVDLARRTARVTFDGAEVPADAVVQQGEDAAAAAEAQLQVAATLTAVEMAGAVDEVLTFTLQWLTDRYSFGRPLASYQALKHRIADDKTWSEGCLAVAAGAARLLDDDPARASETVSAAKSYVGAKAPAIVQDAVQLHGGIGVTWEHDLHLYLRRVTLGRALYGTPEEHRRRIAQILVTEASAVEGSAA